MPDILVYSTNNLVNVFGKIWGQHIPLFMNIYKQLLQLPQCLILVWWFGVIHTLNLQTGFVVSELIMSSDFHLYKCDTSYN